MNEETEEKGVRRIPMHREFLEPLLKSEGWHKIERLPEDATFEKAYMDHTRDTFFFIFRSSEWEPLKQFEEIPIYELDAELFYCPRCRQETFVDEIQDVEYCPSCGETFEGGVDFANI